MTTVENPVARIRRDVAHVVELPLEDGEHQDVGTLGYYDRLDAFCLKVQTGNDDPVYFTAADLAVILKQLKKLEAAEIRALKRELESTE